MSGLSLVFKGNIKVAEQKLKCAASYEGRDESNRERGKALGIWVEERKSKAVSQTFPALEPGWVTSRRWLHFHKKGAGNKCYNW